MLWGPGAGAFDHGASKSLSLIHTVHTARYALCVIHIHIHSKRNVPTSNPNRYVPVAAVSLRLRLRYSYSYSGAGVVGYCYCAMCTARCQPHAARSSGL